MQPMKTNSNNENYKILRGNYVVFVLREAEAGSEFIVLPANTTDEDARRIARNIPSGDWQKVETIHFDLIQSTAAPDSGDSAK